MVRRAPPPGDRPTRWLRRPGGAHLRINFERRCRAAIVQDFIPQARERQETMRRAQPQAETHTPKHREKSAGGEGALFIDARVVLIIAYPSARRSSR